MKLQLVLSADILPIGWIQNSTAMKVGKKSHFEIDQYINVKDKQLLKRHRPYILTPIHTGQGPGLSGVAMLEKKILSRSSVEVRVLLLCSVACLCGGQK